MGALRILEAIRFNNLEKTKFYQAGTSELYGLNEKIPQRKIPPNFILQVHTVLQKCSLDNN